MAGAYSCVTVLVLSFILHVVAQTSGSGYTDYSLKLTGDSGSAIYETDSTDTSNGTANFPPPDVYLNASVHVGEIDILVQSLTAKINLDAQVLNLLSFNAGVNLDIGKVNLVIQNVTAQVELEARLNNLVTMINTTLNSLDLNPVLATLGSAVGNLTSGVGGALTGSGSSSSGSSSTSNTNGTLTARQFQLQQEILYSLNSYTGNTHTNRVLLANGDVVDQFLDNDGHTYGQEKVGTYATLMTKVGEPVPDVIIDGVKATRQEWVYVPTHLGAFGLEAVCYVYTDDQGAVVNTRVVAELEGGGYSTVSDGSINGS